MLTREMVRLLINILNPIKPYNYLEMSDTNITVYLHRVEIKLNKSDLLQSLDDFAEYSLLPYAYMLAAKLKGIKTSYSLKIYNEECLERYCGLAVKGKIGYQPRNDNEYLIFDVKWSGEPTDFLENTG